jgi:hypothetical protein
MSIGYHVGDVFDFDASPRNNSQPERDPPVGARVRLMQSVILGERTQDSAITLEDYCAPNPEEDERSCQEASVLILIRAGSCDAMTSSLTRLGNPLPSSLCVEKQQMAVFLSSPPSPTFVLRNGSLLRQPLPP